MSKTVYSYQEIAHLIESCERTLFECHPVARVTVVQQPWPNTSVKVVINLSIGDTHLGTMETEYTSIADLLDAFQVDDLAEIWEALD